MTHPPIDWFAISPELTLLGAATPALLGAVLLPERLRRPASAAFAAIGFAIAFGWAAALFARSGHPSRVVAEAIYRDRYAAVAALIVCGAGFLATLVSYGERRLREHVGEHFALLATAAAGMVFLAQAGTLLTLFLGLEWLSISLYILCALERDRPEAIEAGFKYLIVGSFGSAILLFGSALTYGATGTLSLPAIAHAAGKGDLLLVAGLAMIITGLGFKASAAPFHMWTPDVYQGAPTPVTAFMAAATKTVALVLALRVLVVAFPEQQHLWTGATAALAVASLAIGNIAALVQRDLKRLLAYSSISHAGYMLIAITAASSLGTRALLFYLIPYGAMSIGSFAIIAVRERELGQAVTLESLAGFGWERPLYGMAMWVFMLGFAGFPIVSGGFWGKFYVFAAAYDQGWVWLVFVGVAATVVSLYYYLGVIRAMYMRSELEASLAVGGSPPPERLLGAAVAICAAVSVGSFFAFGPALRLVGRAATQLIAG
ncbi:MAG: NADH-quinone oxidoreductase subunit N [Gaiellaceae bacterium]